MGEPLTSHSHLWIYQLNRELTRKQTLNDAIDRLDLIDIYRTFHSKIINFTFFSSADGTFFRIDHILHHKSSLGKLKKKTKTEVIPTIFSNHKAVRLGVNYRRNTIKNSNIWRLKNTLLNNQQITEVIKKEIKICTEANENKTKQPITYGTL